MKNIIVKEVEQSSQSAQPSGLNVGTVSLETALILPVITEDAGQRNDKLSGAVSMATDSIVIDSDQLGSQKSTSAVAGNTRSPNPQESDLVKFEK